MIIFTVIVVVPCLPSALYTYSTLPLHHPRPGPMSHQMPTQLHHQKAASVSKMLNKNALVSEISQIFQSQKGYEQEIILKNKNSLLTIKYDAFKKLRYERYFIFQCLTIMLQ